MKTALWCLIGVWAVAILVRGYRAWSAEYERVIAMKNPWVRE